MIQHMKQGTVDVLTSQTSLISDHLEPVAKQLDGCLQDGQPRIVLDLKSAALIDSEGLELLVELRERCQHCGGNLKLAGLNPLITEVLRITGISRQFEVYEDARSAVRSFV